MARRNASARPRLGVAACVENVLIVSSVAALPRIVTIDNVELRPAGTTTKGNLRMNAQAKTYRYLDEGEKQPAAGAKK